MTAIVHPTNEGYKLSDGRVVRVWTGTTEKGNPVRLHVVVLELPRDHDERVPDGMVSGVDPRIPRG